MLIKDKKYVISERALNVKMWCYKKSLWKVSTLGSSWPLWTFGEVWSLTGVETFRILASVRYGHPAFLIILIDKPVSLALWISFIGNHICPKHSSINKLFFWEFLNKNILSFLIIKSKEILCSCDFRSCQSSAIQKL